MTSKLTRKVYVIDISILKKFGEWEQEFEDENKGLYDVNSYRKACANYILMRWNQYENDKRRI